MPKMRRFRSALSLILASFIVVSGIPVSAAKLLPAPTSLGDIVGMGEVHVDGKLVDSGKLLEGNHIRTGDLSNAKVVLLNENRFELSSQSDLLVNHSGEDIQLQLTAGALIFEASNNHITISIGEYELQPETSAFGRIVFTDSNVAEIHLETGGMRIRNTVENSDFLLTGNSERVITVNYNSPDAPDPQAQDPKTQQPAPADSTPQPAQKKPGTLNKKLPIILGAAAGGGVAALLLSRGNDSGPGSPNTTTTLGDGANPPNASLAPGGAATPADAFTFQTSSGTDKITDIRVSLGSGGSGGLSLVEITDDAGTTVYGSIADPLNDTVTIPLSTSITATVTSTQYKIRVTPKSHANMPPPPGLTYQVRAFVVTWTSSSAHLFDDNGVTIVTIDNKSPGNVTDSTATAASDTQNNLKWTNPTDTDFASVVVLRSTAPITVVPGEGVNYVGQVGENLEGSQVTLACVVTNNNLLTTCTDSGVNAQTTYFYKIFAKDSSGNYSTGTTVTDSLHGLTTLSGEHEPTSLIVIGPGASTAADHFNISTSIGSDTITSMTVNVGAGIADRLRLVEITNGTGTIVYGSIANPVTDTVSIPLTSTPLVVTPSARSLLVVVGAKNHADMPAPPGGTYAVNAHVLDWSGGNPHGGNSDGGITVPLRIDNFSPGITGAQATVASSTQVNLSWATATDCDSNFLCGSKLTSLVLKSVSPVVDVPTEGVTYSVGDTIGSSTVLCLVPNSGSGCTDSGLTTGTVYNYKIFAQDIHGNYSVGVAVTASPDVTTIGDAESGTPAPVTVAPGASGTTADSFTFQTLSGADTITAVTVNLGSGQSSGVSVVEITDATGSIVYGSVANPADTTSVPLTTSPITATTTAKSYMVRITPKSHANMPAIPGSTYHLTALVSNWSGNSAHAGADTISTPLAIDNQSPGSVTSPTANAGSSNTQVDLSWTNPSDIDLGSIVALRATLPVTDSPSEGVTYSAGNMVGSSTVGCVVSAPASSCTDTGLTPLAVYFYKVFARDTSGNYGAGMATGAVVTHTLETNTSLSITKAVDHSVVAPGDPISFSLDITNSASESVSAITLNDTLPPGFAFTSGSAMLHYIDASGEETGVQAITPTSNSDGLVFPIASLVAGGRVSISYSAVVKSNAHPGEVKSGAVGFANLLSGRRVTSTPAQVRVTVTAGAFNLNQVLIGRVFDDRNRNGKFDSGEPGVANVRVVTSTGQSATTDIDGQYSLPSLAPGSVLVAVDPITLPPGFELPRHESRLGGAGQMQVTPLDGGGLLRQNFGLVRTSSVPPNVTGESARLEMTVERPIMKAGASDRQLIRIHALDDGNRAMDTSVVVTTTKGSLTTVHKESEQFDCESVLSLDQPSDWTRRLELETEDGEAAICLISDVVPGTTQLTAISGDKSLLRATADLRYEAAQRSPLLVAMGEAGIGLSNPGRNATDGARRVDGQATIFYQNSLGKKDRLTMAVRTKGGINSATGTNGLFESDPTQRVYPVMGDASTAQELAQSSSRLYARYERGQSYIMYGDLRGDTAVENRSGLLEYNRNVNGVRFQIQSENKASWLQGQAARLKTAYKREVTTALSGSAIRLSQSQIVAGSESITLEVRDRRNPEVIVSREALVRNVDYTLDPLSGVLFMLRPISLFDSSLNLAQVVSTYEYQTTGVGSAIYLGRGRYSFENIGLQLGASALSQSEGGAHFTVGGLELEQILLRGGHFKAEVPISSGHYFGDCCDSDNMHNGTAIRAELEQPLGYRDSIVRGRFAKTGEGFFNPYGSIAVQGQQYRSISVDTRGYKSGKLSFGLQQEDNRNSAVDNHRTTASAKLVQTLRENLTAEVGIARRNFTDQKDDRQIRSQLVSVGLKWKPFPRLETSVRREQNLGQADPTYPTQTLLGTQFTLSSGNRIFATQRFSSAPIVPISGAETSGLFSPLSTRETTIGVDSKLRRNTNLTSSYRMDASGTGTDSFAVLGVLARVPVRPGLSFDWTLDNAKHLAGPGKSYVGGSFGFTESKDDTLRVSTRYELRSGDRSQSIFTAGIVGRLSPSSFALVRYRSTDYGAGTTGRVDDGQFAVSVRPKLSDRLALLFSYDFGNGMPNRANLPNTGRTDRLSADGLFEIHHGLEFYSRVAAAKTPGFYGGSRVGTYVQGRLQKFLFSRFDIAGEVRWIQESKLVRGALVTGIEWGTWLTRDFRIGLGYSPSGFANPGALLNSTAVRGGLYMVISSRLSNIFNLMGGSEKTTGREANP